MPEPIDDELAYLLALRPAAAETLAALARPALRLRGASHPPAGATASYVGGHPYLPHGTDWPVDAAGRPRVFVAQVDFGTLPPLPGFPTSGLLQWFVSDADAHGLVGADGALEVPNRSGMAVRWWAAEQLDQPCDPPTTPRPGHEVDPVTPGGPVALVTAPMTSMPPLEELEQVEGLEGLVDEADSADESGDSPWVGNGSKVGGYPHTVQVAPVASVPIDGEQPDPADTLLLQLDSDVDRWTEWGDVGTAQLFGDPAALADGDLSSLWWTWAC